MVSKSKRKIKEKIKDVSRSNVTILNKFQIMHYFLIPQQRLRAMVQHSDYARKNVAHGRKTERNSDYFTIQVSCFIRRRGPMLVSLLVIKQS